MSNLDKVFERNRVTKLGIDAMITNYLRLERENAAQLKELHRISEALGTNEGHSSVTHIETLREQLKDCSAAFDKQQEALDRNAEQLAALRKDASSKWAFLEWRDRAEKAEAKIDALMFEYCPEEMTEEQVNEWKKHQLRKEKDEGANKDTGYEYTDGYEDGYKAGMEEKKPWVGLTDEDKEECLAKWAELGWWGVVDVIEAKLREKNGG